MQRRGDEDQALRLERWLGEVLERFEDRILSFDVECAQMWGQLRVAHPGNPVDKQIAATAYVHGLTVLTGNTAHYLPTGVPVHNPFGIGPRRG
jgi:toxin FitB